MSDDEAAYREHIRKLLGLKGETITVRQMVAATGFSSAHLHQAIHHGRLAVADTATPTRFIITVDAAIDYIIAGVPKERRKITWRRRRKSTSPRTR